MKKVLFIVPHEDDELFVGGQLLINLSRDNNYDVKVFIATNGDYYPYEHKYRIEESINVLKRIGIKESNIIFGGYGDCWKGTHIYNSEGDVNKESFGGFKSTYLDNKRHDEWHFIQCNKHQNYTRNGYLNDIKNLIETILPDVIICVDMDTHRDHRCLSLLTEEALGVILKENIDYRPTVLKKFAYQGVLFGKNDFFEFPHRRTVNETDEMWNPFLIWKDRISYGTADDCDTFFLHSNYLYKLVKMYHTQDMWTHAPSFINQDVVYWKRNSNNEVLCSNISVSSGDKEFLNDFKLVDVHDVQEEKLDYSSLCWRPDNIDNKKEIKIEFVRDISLKWVILYFNCPGGLNGKYQITLKEFCGNQKKYERNIETTESFYIEKIEVSASRVLSMQISLNELKGNIGIGEIEALSGTDIIPFEEYLFTEKSDKPIRGSFLFRFALFIEKIIFKIEKILYYRTDSWIKKREEYDRRNV